MDINFILLLIAVLNLLADLFTVVRFRDRLPRWILWANIMALLLCAAGWLFAPDYAGYFGLAVLIAYVVMIKWRTRGQTSNHNLPSRATKVLIGLNIATFLVQASRGATDDPIAFIDLGALYTPLLAQGEWWRIFSAQFLHWGALHLAFNMLGLWMLGRIVEATIGFWKYIGLYLTCGAGGMLIAWSCSLLMPEPRPIILLGASASVLGLVGSQAAMALLALRLTGNPVAKAQLTSMSQIVFLQAIFDMMVPQVSSTAHVGGAAVGFCVTYGFIRRKLRREGRLHSA